MRTYANLRSLLLTFATSSFQRLISGAISGTAPSAHFQITKITCNLTPFHQPTLRTPSPTFFSESKALTRSHHVEPYHKYFTAKSLNQEDTLPKIANSSQSILSARDISDTTAESESNGRALNPSHTMQLLTSFAGQKTIRQISSTSQQN